MSSRLIKWPVSLMKFIEEIFVSITEVPGSLNHLFICFTISPPWMLMLLLLLEGESIPAHSIESTPMQ